SRKHLLSLALNERRIIAEPHLPLPGLGHLQRNKKGYRWNPVEYRNPIN
ncbi:MBL fold metallo-hydrolase, partial [Pseudoalteromonas sp. S1731]